MKWILLAIIASWILLLPFRSVAAESKYSVRQRTDGGFTLDIETSKKHMSPITAEGMFPVETTRGTIDIIGSGEYWEKGKHTGYFYPISKIRSTTQLWDYGYAWVDSKREKLYLNLYWAVPPHGMRKSQFYGVYLLRRK